MMILNCTEAFHHKYLKFSSADQVQGVELTKENSNKKKLQKSGTRKADYDLFDEYMEKDISETDDIKAIIETIDNEENATANALASLNEIFEKLDFGSDDLFDSIVKAYQRKNAKNIQATKPKYYDLALDHLMQKYPNENITYYCEMHFEDIVLLLCSILKAFTTLNIRLQLGKSPNRLILMFYGDEQQFNFLADFFDYELQLRTYAITYDNETKKFADKKGTLSTLFDKIQADPPKEANSNIAHNESELVGLIDHIDDRKVNSALQFEKLDFNAPILWPPYTEFEQKKEYKFRLYEPDDQFHECALDEDPQIKIGDKEGHNVSKFRNIDKLRLMNIALDKFLRLNYLKKKGILINFLYKRNFESYQTKIAPLNLFHLTWNIFSNKTFLEFINLIRNFYGEVTAYYFLWVESYIMWLFFPSGLGFIVGIMALINPFSDEPLLPTPITVMDIIMMLYCIIITIWATLFLKTWKKKEKLYAYIWGTENFIHNEPDSEDYVPDKSIDFIFGKSINIVNPIYYYLKKVVSYFVLLIMIVATVSITCLLLYHKKDFVREDTKANYWYNTFVSMFVASINAIQIKIFNFIYNFIAEKLNYWENYQKEYQKLNDLAVKLIIFDFMNCYSACFYIGFIKPNIDDPCIGTCIQEIETQLYTTLSMNFALNAVEMGLPFLMYTFREYMYKRKLSEEERKSHKVVTHSILHQLFCDENTNMIHEYNELFILFGYLCLFSVTAPFTPLMVLILVWAEKIMDTFKRFFFERCQNLDQATGIEIYNTLMRVLMFVGMLTNVGVVLFSKEFNVNNDLLYKVLIFFCVENFIIVLIFVLHWNILPIWFDYTQDIKELYDKKFYRRKNANLPHNSIKAVSKASNYLKFKNKLKHE